MESRIVLYKLVKKPNLGILNKIIIEKLSAIARGAIRRVLRRAGVLGAYRRT